ncbi:unnamed protein product [Penicillium nalgiovense]|uniref:Cyanovirin-N domain-containing protein n=1 Tax=Penicillium nalgiovense TaxID=60175 RepID=A0A9W4HRM0_PENNA|nr:unnamed protein product [Penicillium nalgiovense]CAG7983764.1 unnamed protein product [Penicillium nalgiovense]CAG8059652.1 unnamed protein product [Penicillium nalgiovense]CAG8086555.1 unnamed protein product [Penicillium nalgiovense]CAG8086817.1 unnamed protein product [Penicillium nalgiovense]
MIHTLYTLLYILLSQIDTMSFHETASEIELEDGHILKAVLRNEDGDEQESTLDLNEHIGNDNGMFHVQSDLCPCITPTYLHRLCDTSRSNYLVGQFHWDGGDFHSSAEDVSLEREGDDDVPILRARLHDVEGELQDADINLAERIGNDNGELVFN